MRHSDMEGTRSAQKKAMEQLRRRVDQQRKENQEKQLEEQLVLGIAERLDAGRRREMKVARRLVGLGYAPEDVLGLVEARRDMLTAFAGHALAGLIAGSDSPTNEETADKLVSSAWVYALKMTERFDKAIQGIESP